MNKPHEMPALLSLLAPGFGQLVKKHIGKALLIIIVFILLILNIKLGWVLGDNEHLYLISGFIYFALTAFSVYDAYHSNDDWSGDK